MRAEKIGIIAMGSHRERHGSALPEDTDAKLASHVALEAAKRTGAKFLGVIYSSHELPHIDTGIHCPLDDVAAELAERLSRAKEALGIRAAVIVNGHGGNNPLAEMISEIGRTVGMKLRFNARIIELEGPHAGTGEVSMGAAAGIARREGLKDHCNFSKHPEVGFVGLKEARKAYSWAEEHAREVERRGVRIEMRRGLRMLEEAIGSVVRDVDVLAGG
ncbi:MAG: 2-amino-5-formylamino-6-ribosylaminopyrimidin-4(3H)-one 5'-monophosphate deformylase [Candidatus Hadarchaeales archaeon]